MHSEITMYLACQLASSLCMSIITPEDICSGNFYQGVCTVTLPSLLLQCSLYMQQFRAMFIKRVMFSWRNWKLLLLQLLALLGLMYLLMKGISFSAPVQPARVMDLEQYGETTIPFSVSGDPHLTPILTKNLEIMFNSKKQKIHEVQGKSLTNRGIVPTDEDPLISI